ncbi:MAG: PilZ domain-containing protein [Bryobacteraceae bacterium]
MVNFDLAYSVASQTKARRGKADRRSRRRFQLEQQVLYTYVAADRQSCKGDGKTLDISSSGVRFTTGSSLNIGQNVELRLEWPALLDNRCPIKLVIRGYVVRADASSAVITVRDYEFRTRGLQPEGVAPAV